MAEVSFILRVRNYMEQGLNSARRSLQGFNKQTGKMMGGLFGLGSVAMIGQTLSKVIEQAEELKKLGADSSIVNPEELARLKDARERIRVAKEEVAKLTVAAANNGVTMAKSIGAYLGAMTMAIDGTIKWRDVTKNAQESLAKDVSKESDESRLERLKEEIRLQEEKVKLLQEENKEKSAQVQSFVTDEVKEANKQIEIALASMSERKQMRREEREAKKRDRRFASILKQAERRERHNERFGRIGNDATSGLPERAAAALMAKYLMISSRQTADTDPLGVAKKQLDELKGISKTLAEAISMK